VLLQCHLSRMELPSPELRCDQVKVLQDSIRLLQAIVDVISSNGWLKPALAAMETSQMVVQALWNKDSVLLQIPHFTKEIVARCEAHQGEETVDSVFDILNLEDDVRNSLLQLPEDKMADVAVFCNNYPNIEVSFKVHDSESVAAGDPVQIEVSLEREVDENDSEVDIGVVSAALFPSDKVKHEGWWIVIGDTQTNTIFSLKRVTLIRTQKVNLEFLAPEEPGDYNLTLFCMSDSYLGCDQEYELSLSVAAASGVDDSSEEDDSHSIE